MQRRGVSPTAHRLIVLEVIGANQMPLSAEEIHKTVLRTHDINKVTVYRILDILVEKGIVERLSAGDQSFRYGLAANENHPHHAHFYCKICGHMECLDPSSVQVNSAPLKRFHSGVIERAEIRFDGICKNCLV